MPIGWVKSLHCKSKAFDDVYHHHSNKGKLLLPSYSCRKNVRDVVNTQPGTVKKNPKPDPSLRRLCSSRRPELDSNSHHPTRRSVSARASSESVLPVLTDLPDGHPSRNVVEIIFQSSWSSDEFPGRVEMIFKVENGSKAVTRFEEYREAVKSRSCSKVDSDRVDGGACDENARCSADGNEMMRFFPLGPIPGGINGGAWGFPGGKGAAVCTFSGSGEAHASTGGGGGRRAMLICRVIAGRVAKKGEFGSDSVAGRAGELIVFDARAVLPCFLIFFRL
ncbi:unnamed protein product [Arabidopsis thaliana]|uniref:Zinc finger (C2H2 type) family protein n=1 Tax=Arabidopsis thaliana TaxID=3702 RepID=A0A178UYM0_ARATH|nr:hypothetical protein AXX17_AT4G14020 [Arabidopsis thaliana]OAO98998.1 hypothetical protein AXX17_AT4G14050 [Arabidopsis thaliana]VYS62418.1 unnamed protein product [Arabidopsis thaliana]